MPTTVSNPPIPVPPPESLAGFGVSLGFWCCLLISAVLFGTVALAPKFQTQMHLRSQFDANQFELVRLERQATRLQRVIDAIRTDQQFASEMARIELDAVKPDEEIIPVHPELKLDSGNDAVIPHTQTAGEEWYVPALNSIADEPRIRNAILVVAALLIVASFSLLQPIGLVPSSSESPQSTTIWRSVKGRYVHHP